MPRLFVAIELPDEIKLSLTPLTRGLGDVRWLDEDQRHLTLRFIGELDHGGLEDVIEALAMVNGAPFELRLEGIGHFPPRGEPRVIWAGVARSESLHRLKRSVDRALNGIGLTPENRKFAPHVTLARLRRPPPPHRLASWLAAHSLYRSQPFLVRGFHLYSSWLRAEGADHILEAGYELHPANGARPDEDDFVP